MNTAPMSYDVRWEAFRAGDSDAFGQIYFAHYESLLNYGRRFGLPRDIVEDCVQDLFLELWRGRSGLSPTTSVRFYLLRALRNKISRLTEHPQSVELNEATLPFAVDYTFEPQWMVLEEDQAKWAVLLEAINRLTPRQKEVLYLRFFNDLDYPDIAAVMGLSYQVTRNQLYLALKALRDDLRPVQDRFFLFWLGVLLEKI